MLDYILMTDKVNEALSLFSRLFDLRIAFFDTKDIELFMFDVKQRSNYCKEIRSMPDLCTLCEKSDLAHLQKAKSEHRIIIYHCHRKLYEAIVPLFDSNDNYLGSLMFGQLRDSRQPIPDQPSDTLRDEFTKLPEITYKRAKEVATLLKYISESIIEKEWLKRRRENWAGALQEYIDANLTGNISIEMLARISNCSVSFITHNFPTFFGKSPMKYIMAKKLEAARNELDSGLKVYEVAQKYGFSDQYHFSKAFRKYFNHPPSKCGQ